METRYKYPRTPHLPWSLGCTDDDKKLSSVDHFKNKNVVVTLKMDGENTTVYRDGMHARSLDSKPHPSRAWIQNKLGEIQHLIPEGIRLCGENLYAKHSIHYLSLPNYFMLFSAWKGETCLSWDQTKELATKLNLELVPVIYEGIFNEKAIKEAFKPFEASDEGYVIRLCDSFTYSTFETSVAKSVRKGHVQTDKHWMHQAIVKNQLKE